MRLYATRGPASPALRLSGDDLDASRGQVAQRDGARAAHFAMALAAARHVDPATDLPVPEGVTPEEAERVRQLVDGMFPRTRRAIEQTLAFDDGTEEVVDLSHVPYEEHQKTIDAAARGRRVVCGTARAYTTPVDVPTA